MYQSPVSCLECLFGGIQLYALGFSKPQMELKKLLFIRSEYGPITRLDHFFYLQISAYTACFLYTWQVLTVDAAAADFSTSIIK